jgi:predicted nucleic acid-binding protein
VAHELFGSAVTKPDVIFCDTSFIVDILTDEVAEVSNLFGSNTDKRNRAAASAAFFHAYRGYGSQFVSSPYTFSEVGHIIARKVLDGHGHRTWKDFRRADRRMSHEVYRKTMRLMLDAWRRVAGYDIWFLLPVTGVETPFGSRAEENVMRAARLFKATYMDLDWADAYHIAIGMACGTNWFATTDKGWKSVAEINVFCDS